MVDKQKWTKALFKIDGQTDGSKYIEVSGRDRWALEALIAAGRRGCTPIDTPGPRWSSYVHNLRKLSVPVETLTEPHSGPFSGTHARYILRASVRRVEDRAA